MRASGNQQKTLKCFKYWDQQIDNIKDIKLREAVENKNKVYKNIKKWAVFKKLNCRNENNS